MLLADLISQMLVWVWYLSCSQITFHYHHWIQPNVFPQTEKHPIPQCSQMYSRICGASYEDLSSCTFHYYQVHTFYSIKWSKTILATSTYRFLRSIKRTLQVHTTFFNQTKWEWAAASILNSSTNALSMPHISIFYRWPKLGYTQDYKSLTPKFPTIAAPVLLTRDPACPIIPMFTENLYTGNHFHCDYIFLNKVSCREFTPDLTTIDATTSHLFSYPTR